ARSPDRAHRKNRSLPSIGSPSHCRGLPPGRQYQRCLPMCPGAKKGVPSPFSHQGRFKSEGPRAMVDHFGSQALLRAGEHEYTIFRLSAVEKAFPQAARLPFSLKVLLENLLRTEDGQTVRAGDIEALARWDAKASPSTEIAFTPARVLLQDF